MAVANSTLSARLLRIAACFDTCHKAADWLSCPGCEDETVQACMLYLLEAQIGRLTDELNDIAEGDELRELERNGGAA